jgi:hypothetical protein
VNKKKKLLPPPPLCEERKREREAKTILCTFERRLLLPIHHAMAA